MDITLDDFLQKYKNTFVFLKSSQGLILTEFIDHDNHLWFKEPELGTIQVTFDNAKKTIVTKFPKTGIYNFGDVLFGFLYRQPERQFKCCPHHQNTSIKEVFTEQFLPIDINTIKTAFDSKYPHSKKDAISLVNTRGGVALNSRFGVTLSDECDFNLYYNINHIGTIHQDKIDLHYQPLLQEVKDYFGEDLVWKS